MHRCSVSLLNKAHTHTHTLSLSLSPGKDVLESTVHRGLLHETLGVLPHAL